jgi:peptide/nickel transport system substrate-binding protein
MSSRLCSLLLALLLALATALLGACREQSESTTTATSNAGAPPKVDAPLKSAGDSEASPYEAIQAESGETVYTGERHVELGREYPIQGRVVERNYGGWKRLNPITRTLPVEEKVLSFHLNLFLLEEHPEEIEPMCMLARSLPDIRDDEQIWEIRPEATWDDGQSITAADAVATWKAIQAASKTIGRVVYESLGGEKVLGVEAVDERRFRVRIKAGENGRLTSQAFGLSFGICDARTIPQTLEALDETRSLAGSGPYRLKGGAIDSMQLTLERKQPWWGDKVEAFRNRWRLAEYVYKVVQDDLQVEEQLRRGDIDIAPITKIKRYAALKGEPWDENFEKAHYYLSQFSFIGWNCSRAPFNDRRVRLAMSHLVPRRRINKEKFEGLSQLRSGPFFSKSIYSDASIEGPRFSPKKALALLEEAGWKDRDGDGILDKDGKPFEFAMMRQSASAAHQAAVLELFAETLKQVGISMAIDVVDATGALYTRAGRQDYDAYILIWGLELLLPGEGLEQLYSSKGHYNWQAFSDARTDELLKAFDQDDEIKRVQAAHALHARLHEMQPMTFLFTNPACVIWNRRVKNVIPHVLGVRPWDFRVGP